MNRKMMHLAVGKPQEYHWNQKVERSGIGKSFTAAAALKKEGFVGDDVANKAFHGGVDRAVCLYPFEHYAYWENLFHTKLPLPAFGENITATGMREEQVYIGDVYRLGEALVQVTQGRVPCVTISHYNAEARLLGQVVETCFTGYFFRVLEEGTIQADDAITLVERHPDEVSVQFATHILFHQRGDVAAIERILGVDALSEEWRNRFLKLL